MTNSFHSFLHNASIGMLVVAPILIAIPPRKLDLYTFSLLGGMTASVNHLCKERTGAGLLYQLPGARLPSYAQQYQEEPLGRRLLEEDNLQPMLRSQPDVAKISKIESATKDDWKKQRLAEEQQKLDEGEGYGGMIMDQIWDVWNQAEKKAEDLKEKDAAVVEASGRVSRANTWELKREAEFPTIGRNG